MTNFSTCPTDQLWPTDPQNEHDDVEFDPGDSLGWGLVFGELGDSILEIHEKVYHDGASYYLIAIVERGCGYIKAYMDQDEEESTILLFDDEEDAIAWRDHHCELERIEK
jgi:hypothetical protein